MNDVPYGNALSFVHPPDNKMPGPFIDQLNTMNLTEEQRQELQDRIDDLYRVLRGERDYV